MRSGRRVENKPKTIRGSGTSLLALKNQSHSKPNALAVKAERKHIDKKLGSRDVKAAVATNTRTEGPKGDNAHL